MLQFLNKLPLTLIKIKIASFLYLIVKLFCRSDNKRILRNGIWYDVDLSEGLDFSLFLLRAFQKHITHSSLFSIKKDAIVIDVGANIGIMTLNFARITPKGHVFAFEPTNYAFSKLQKNIVLNPELQKRITIVQSFVSSVSKKSTDMTAYASWKLGGAHDGIKHDIHGGTIKDTSTIGAISLDDYCSLNRVSNVDLIKIDTDGYEYDVLKGAEKIISDFSPIIVFEAGLYILCERKIIFEQFLDFFEYYKYELWHSQKKVKITKANYNCYIPINATIDIVAIPENNNKNTN
jgi:FkbM family methyltransferase